MGTAEYFQYINTTHKINQKPFKFLSIGVRYIHKWRFGPGDWYKNILCLFFGTVKYIAAAFGLFIFEPNGWETNLGPKMVYHVFPFCTHRIDGHRFWFVDCVNLKWRKKCLADFIDCPMDHMF